jgi:hypothetical protein
MPPSPFSAIDFDDDEDPLAKMRAEREQRRAYFFIEGVLREGDIAGKELVETLTFLLVPEVGEKPFPREWVLEAASCLKRLSAISPATLGKTLADINSKWDDEIIDNAHEDPFYVRRLLAWHPFPNAEIDEATILMIRQTARAATPDEFEAAYAPFRTTRRPKAPFYPSLLRRLLLEEESDAPSYVRLLNEMVLESTRRHPVIGYDNAITFIDALHRARGYPGGEMTSFLDANALRMASLRLEVSGNASRSEHFKSMANQAAPDENKRREHNMEAKVRKIEEASPLVATATTPSATDRPFQPLPSEKPKAGFFARLLGRAK